MKVICKTILYVMVLTLMSCTQGAESSKLEELFVNPEPLPSQIVSVNPEPGEVVMLSDPDLPGERDHVCAVINVQLLLEEGDDLFPFRHVSLMYNDQPIDQKFTTHFDNDSLVQIGDARGPITHEVCWQISPVIGLHIVEMDVWTTSGKKTTYKWVYKITE